MPTPARTTVVTLVGVPVEVTGPADVLPAYPDMSPVPDWLAEVMWRSVDVAFYTSVLMTDDRRWTVTSVPRRTSSGGRAITLTSPVPGPRVSITLTVPLNGLDVPMWWVGEVPPGPPQDEDGEHTDEPPPPAPETPLAEPPPVG